MWPPAPYDGAPTCSSHGEAVHGSPDGDAPSRLLRSPAIRRALRVIRETDARTLREQVEIAEIPAPPFQEKERGARLLQGFRDAGLERVRRDTEGNVLGWVPGREGASSVVLSAHLDTIFPAGTDTRIRRQSDRYVGPSITDDARGLAALLSAARAVRSGTLRIRHSLLFAATVGEEGPGNLRGVKHLFAEGSVVGPCRAFISLDGAGLRGIVVRGVGSVRLRFRVRGGGGHSWTDWGKANPLHALSRGLARCLRLSLPATPRTTLTVARWGGGQAINAIPDEGWVELDLRSESQNALTTLEAQVRTGMSEGVAEEHPDRTPLRLVVEEIGRRPAGATAPHTPLVQAALGATRLAGAEGHLLASSTDANIPMSLGIPAITMGAGGEGGRAHTLHEWYRNIRGPEGIARGLLTALAVAGVEGS